MTPLTVLFDDAGRGAGDRNIRRDITHHDEAIGTYHDIVPDCQRSEKGRTGTDVDIVAQRRVTFAVVLARPTERDIVEYHAVLSDDGCLTNDHTHAVVDKKAGTDCGAGVYLQTGHEAVDLGEQSWQERDTQFVYEVDEAMSHYRPETGVQEYLQVAGGRIVAINRFGVFN